MLASPSLFWSLLTAAALVGIGSVRLPSRVVAHRAAGFWAAVTASRSRCSRQAATRLVARPAARAFIVLPRGQGPALRWFSVAALVGDRVLWQIGGWYARRLNAASTHAHAGGAAASRSGRRSLAVLRPRVLEVRLPREPDELLHVLSDSPFHVSVQSAQLHLFAFLGAVAAGTFLGGPIGDRFGRKNVIWASILGVLPFTRPTLRVVVLDGRPQRGDRTGHFLGLFSDSRLRPGTPAWPRWPGRGPLLRLAFGVGGLSAAALGRLADLTSIEVVYRLTAFLPAIGLLTALLPDLKTNKLR